MKNTPRCWHVGESQQPCPDCKRWMDALGQLQETLRPFATEADRFGESFTDDFRPDVKMHYTVGDLRRARSAVA